MSWVPFYLDVNIPGSYTLGLNYCSKISFTHDYCITTVEMAVPSLLLSALHSAAVMLMESVFYIACHCSGIMQTSDAVQIQIITHETCSKYKLHTPVALSHLDSEQDSHAL